MVTEDQDRQATLERLRQWSIEATADFKKTFGVVPGRWLQMEAEYGPLGACQRILQPHPEQWWVPALTRLWEAGRMQWSVEAAALSPEFRGLFTPTEKTVAQTRLLLLGRDSPTE
jgi:hypothetical protein